MTIFINLKLCYICNNTTKPFFALYVAVSLYVPSPDCVALSQCTLNDAIAVNFNAAPNLSHILALNLISADRLTSDSILIVEQQINGNWYQLAGTTFIKGLTRVTFWPTSPVVRWRLVGPYLVVVGSACVTQPIQSQQAVLVDICNTDGDRYRFGFNGQEKVNEWAGIGNHNTAEFWEYDTRTGRRLNTDPVVKPRESSYAAFNNSPIFVGDPDGKDGVVSGSGATKEDPLVIKANYYYSGLSDNEEKALIKAVSEYNKKDADGNNQVWEIKTGPDQVKYVRFDIHAFKRDDALTAENDARKIDRVEGENADAPMIHWGNSVGIGATGGGDLGGANSNNIVLDRSKISSHVTNYPSRDPKEDEIELMTGVFVHEIGHNLGGNHGDPGNMMVHESTDPAKKDFGTGAGNTIIDNSATYKYTISTVNEDGVRAIIGRIGEDYHTIQSKYLSDKEMKKVKNADDENIKKGQPSGSAGRLIIIK